jgi:uncharacterized protein YecE (DUF72 family)
MDPAHAIKVGTSGWSYDHWRGVFYPEHLSAAKRLAYYAQRFRTVEIDATFYRLPSEHAVRAWHDAVPDGFAFAVKGSRFITHFRRLADAKEATTTFLERVALLGDKLAVVLWQLPPDLRADPALLEAFLAGLPKGPVRHAIEFRHESWLAEQTFDILRAHNAAHVSVSSDVMEENLTVTADFVYVRFHGTASYHGAYTHPALEPWAEFLREQVRQGRDGYAYFNNDAEGHAPRDAERLTRMLGASDLGHGVRD